MLCQLKKDLYFCNDLDKMHLRKFCICGEILNKDETNFKYCIHSRDDGGDAGIVFK